MKAIKWIELVAAPSVTNCQPKNPRDQSGSICILYSKYRFVVRESTEGGADSSMLSSSCISDRVTTLHHFRFTAGVYPLHSVCCRPLPLSGTRVV